MAYWASIQELTNESPFYLLHEGSTRPTDNALSGAHVVDTNEYNTALTVGLSKARKGAQENIRHAE